MNFKKTIFCDIDGTLCSHIGGPYEQTTICNNELLPNTTSAIGLWDKLGYTIILTTGRKESMRQITEQLLTKLGIVYDQLIMGLGSGDRILINDKKENGIQNTCYAINVVRNKGIHHFDFTSKNVTIPDDQTYEVIKPWGKEELIEYNDKYVVKKLFMKKGEFCSLQYHELKKETIYVLDGILKLYIGKNMDDIKELILNKNDTVTIEPYKIHRMEGIEDSTYLECSTNELWDVIRLKDKYGR